jgi:phosphate uptake regulator
VTGHRREFDHQLDAIDAKVMELFAMVCEDLRPVTQAVLNGHNGIAESLAERERAIDTLYREIEQLVSREILLQAPVASDLRFPLSVLRIAPELERSHDLVCHIASRADRIPGLGVAPAVQRDRHPVQAGRGVGMGVAMTPATAAITEGLPAAQQGVFRAAVAAVISR